MVLHAELPAASQAYTVTTFVPTSTGACRLQYAVPDAVPEAPVEVVHVTAVTPTLSFAVPLTAMLVEDVETIVEAGETMRSVGGVVSLPVEGEAGADGVDGGLIRGLSGAVDAAAGYRLRMPAISPAVKPFARW